MKRMFVCLVLLFLLPSCASMNVNREFDANQNTFISTRWPNIKIKINPDLKFIGEINSKQGLRNSDDLSGTSAKNQYFVFAKGNISLEKFFIITISQLQKGYYWKELFYDDEFNIKKQNTKINGDRYQGVIRIFGPRIFNQDVSDCLIKNGFYVENTYLTKRIGKRIKNKEIKVYMDYGLAMNEANSVINNWTAGNGFNEEQRKCLKNIEYDFLNDIEIVENNQ
ncbi:MAG: hypothetical protein PHO79_02155 [Desulfoplanes sp.]|nr:hypothetical protein [Desulfoplanes sp.]